MRYVMTIIWALLLGVVLSYVLSSMAAEPFNVSATIAFIIIISLSVFWLGDGVLGDEKEN
ncbi:DUF2929 family protein [Virgibacillus kimchii]